VAVDAVATREAVLDAALALVDEGGLAAVTIAALAARSGVSNGSIYHHFGSREGVLRRLLVDGFAALAARLAAALDGRPARDCVHDLVHRHLRWVVEEPGRAAVVYGVPLDAVVVAEGAGAPAVAAQKAGAAAPLVAWFAARAAAGELREVPAWALDPVVLGPVHEVARRGMAGEPGVAAVVADAVWAVVRPARPGDG
jgi:AcrR family transcriptional regulator